MSTGVRTEQFCGEGYRDAASVMAHEVLDLQNTDIIDTLCKTILKDSSLRYELEELKECIDSSGDTSYPKIKELYEKAYEDESIGIKYFNKVLDAVNSVSGKNIKYALWLCNSIDDVCDSYGYGDNFTEFDFYDASDVVLSDCDKEGKLYGYEELPKVLRTKYVV